MQVGARWKSGSPPHRGVPEQLHVAIATQEEAYPDAVAWTLTWLEGRPNCRLDDVALVTLDENGAVSSTNNASELLVNGETDAGHEDEDDDWLT